MAMLFITIGKAKGSSTAKERIGRRAQWDYPPGMKILAEYWPIGSAVAVITIAEAERAAPIMAALADWDDVFDMEVFPTVTAEEGLAMAAQMS